MRRVPCQYLQPGMVLANHVYNYDGRVLLAKGVSLTETYIAGLIQKGIISVYVEDEISKDIYISDIVLEETRLEATKQVKHIFDNIYSGLITEKTTDLKTIKSITSKIIDQLLQNKNLLYELVDVRAVGDYLFSHSVNVCVLALTTGLALKMSRSQLEQLSVGAIFHDIGKALTPPKILNKPGKLEVDEFEEMKKHPVHSLSILRKNDNVDSVSRIIAYQHHEKVNGSGYPLGKKGDEILEMSQIVGMVDIYDAVTSERCYSKAMPPNKAFELISASSDQYFNSNIVNSFLSQIAAFPSGSPVELNTGEVAIVVQNYKYLPFLPRVRVLADPDGAILKPFNEIELSEHTERKITRILEEYEIQNILLKIKKMLK
ncbi:MAG: HD-GYP domain-containing protein [Bacillota bacterium]